jgi:hypothetical protein
MEASGRTAYGRLLKIKMQVEAEQQRSAYSMPEHGERRFFVQI